MDANNNSPKVVLSNLPVPTIIVQPSTPLPSTPKRKILPPVLPNRPGTNIRYGHKMGCKSQGCRGCHTYPQLRKSPVFCGEMKRRKSFQKVSTPVLEQLARRRVETNSVNTGNTINKLPEKIENKLMKKVYDNRLVDENIGLKGELNSSRIKCEELQKQHSESHEKNIALKVELNSSRIECEELQKQLSESRQKNSVLEVNDFIDQGLFEVTRY